MRLPGRIIPGSVSGERVACYDYWPIFCDFAGIPYEGGIRIPLIIHWPGTVRSGRVSDKLVACQDFLPTFADITGSNRDSLELDGVSLRPLLEESGRLNRDTLFWHYPRYHHSTPSSAIISNQYKLIHFYEDGRNELYDLSKDEGERFDLSKKIPSTKRKLLAKLSTWLESVEAAIPQPNPEFDPAKQLIWGPRPRDSWQKQFALPE